MLLKELCNLCAPSGWEDEARKFILERIGGYETFVDTMGNIIAHKKGDGKKIMVAAHMDEVGFIVSGFTDEGFVKFKTVGGILTTVLVSKKVILGEKKVAGIIGAKAVHLQKRDEREKPLPLSELYIDIGAKSKAEAEEMLSLGDYGTFAGEFAEFGAGCIKSKALDDRVGCAAMLELMENDYKNDMYFVFTVQEEVGLRGAIIAANRIQPQYALVLEGTTCSDVYGAKPHETVTYMGGGAVMTAMDRAAVSDRKYFEMIKSVAKREEIPLQIKRTSMGGTDAGSIQRSGGGVKTAVLAVPCRYIHSPVGVISKNDYNSLVRLSGAVLKELEGSDL